LANSDEPVAEDVSAHRRLRFADEHNEVVLPARIIPDEKATRRQPAGLDQALSRHMVDVKQLAGRKLGQQVHAQLRHQVKSPR